MSTPFSGIKHVARVFRASSIELRASLGSVAEDALTICSNSRFIMDPSVIGVEVTTTGIAPSDGAGTLRGIPTRAKHATIIAPTTSIDGPHERLKREVGGVWCTRIERRGGKERHIGAVNIYLPNF